MICTRIPAVSAGSRNANATDSACGSTHSIPNVMSGVNQSVTMLIYFSYYF